MEREGSGLSLGVVYEVSQSFAWGLRWRAHSDPCGSLGSEPGVSGVRKEISRDLREMPRWLSKAQLFWKELPTARLSTAGRPKGGEGEYSGRQGSESSSESAGRRFDREQLPA